MNDIKIDENMKRALDLFASFDLELQGITLKNINELSNGNSYATYHNNYVKKLSEEDKHIFISKISEIYESSLKDEKSVQLFYDEINKIWDTEDKKSFLDALINIDKNDFPENIKNTRNLLLTKYSPRVKEKIINNLSLNLKNIKEMEDQKSANIFIDVLKGKLDQQEINNFFNILTSKREIKPSSEKVKKISNLFLDGYNENTRKLILNQIEPSVREFEKNDLSHFNFILESKMNLAKKQFYLLALVQPDNEKLKTIGRAKDKQAIESLLSKTDETIDRYIETLKISIKKDKENKKNNYLNKFYKLYNELTETQKISMKGIDFGIPYLTVDETQFVSNEVKEVVKILNKLSYKDSMNLRFNKDFISPSELAKIKEKNRVDNFINSFNKLESHEKNRVILTGYLDKLNSAYDLPEHIDILIVDLKEMPLGNRIDVYSKLLNTYLEENDLDKVYLTPSELKKVEDFKLKTNVLSFEDKLDLLRMEVRGEKSSRLILNDLHVELKELNTYQKDIVINDLLKKTKTELKEINTKEKIPNANNLFGKLKNKLFGIVDNNIENKNDGPKI